MYPFNFRVFSNNFKNCAAYLSAKLQQEKELLLVRKGKSYKSRSVDKVDLSLAGEKFDNNWETIRELGEYQNVEMKSLLSEYGGSLEFAFSEIVVLFFGH